MIASITSTTTSTTSSTTTASLAAMAFTITTTSTTTSLPLPHYTITLLAEMLNVSVLPNVITYSAANSACEKCEQ